MKLRLSFLLPLGLFAFALFYAGFTLSLETERMIGDAFGYDPGSRLVPLLTAGVLGIAMLVEMGRALRREPSGAGSDATWLVLANIAIGIVFIGAFRYLGFLLTTAASLFMLIALNLRAAEPERRTQPFLGLALTLVYAVAAYSAIRGVVRLCFALSREFELPLFREPALQATMAVATSIIVLFVGRFLIRRVPAARNFATAVQVSVGVTLAIYVVFRLFFLVQLPQGVVWW